MNFGLVSHLGWTYLFYSLFVVPFNKKHQCFYVLAASKTSYARELKQMQHATDYSLHNQFVSISGPFLDLK